MYQSEFHLAQHDETSQTRTAGEMLVLHHIHCGANPDQRIKAGAHLMLHFSLSPSFRSFYSSLQGLEPFFHFELQVYSCDITRKMLFSFKTSCILLLFTTVVAFAVPVPEPGHDEIGHGMLVKREPGSVVCVANTPTCVCVNGRCK